MKKLLKLLFITAIVALPFAFAPDQKADKPFEGVITYTMSSDNEQQNAMMQGNTLILYVKGNKQKVVINSGAYISTLIVDTTKPEDMINLQEVMDHKFEVVRDAKQKEQAKKDIAENAKKLTPITYTKETKIIAGYTCSKALAKMAGSEDSVTVTLYYTDQLFNYPGPLGEFNGLKGFPMEYSEPVSDKLNFIYTVKSVEKKPLADSVFTVPTGYKKVTSDQLQKEMETIGAGN